MYPFWILLELRMAVTTGAVRRAKLQSFHHHQQTICTGRTDALPVTQPTVSEHWRKNRRWWLQSTMFATKNRDVNTEMNVTYWTLDIDGSCCVSHIYSGHIRRTMSSSVGYLVLWTLTDTVQLNWASLVFVTTLTVGTLMLACCTVS